MDDFTGSAASQADFIWKNAEDLWGDFKHTDFGKIILPFTLLRRLECALEPFKKLVKTVHNHYDDIFAYWDAPFSITNGYTEGLNGLIKMSNRLGRGYSYDIIRAKTLYSKEARKVGCGIRAGRGKVEYGPHIPTLLKQAESGELD